MLNGQILKQTEDSIDPNVMPVIVFQGSLKSKTVGTPQEEI